MVSVEGWRGAPLEGVMPKYYRQAFDGLTRF